MALLDQLRLASVDFLKMDIQGSEWEVLFSTPTSVLRCIRRIEFEYHEVHARFQYTPDRLIAHLGMAGHALIYRSEDEHAMGLAILERTEITDPVVVPGAIRRLVLEAGCRV